MSSSYFSLTVLLMFAFVHYSSQRFVQNGCHLNVTHITSHDHKPVIVNSHMKMIFPVKGAVDLKMRELVILACPGSRNNVKMLGSETVEALCQGGNDFRIQNKLIDFEDINCAKAVHADVKKVHKKCAHNADSYVIGYNLKGVDDRVPLIDVCYDSENGITLYTKHYLHGDQIKYASRSSDRTSFSTAGLPPDIKAPQVYKPSFQKTHFSALFGSTPYTEGYINKNSYLSTGHLAPRADFLYSDSQRSTYFYINAAPQWQTINNGNWKLVENLVRRTAEKYGKTLQIVTGTYGILKLPDSRNELIPVTLQREKLPVPKYIWKILYDPSTKKGIALIVLNDPFTTKHPEETEFCRNICNKYGWQKTQWNNYKKGHIFCCEIEDLRSTVRTVPDFQVNGVFLGIM